MFSIWVLVGPSFAAAFRCGDLRNWIWEETNMTHQEVVSYERNDLINNADGYGRDSHVRWQPCNLPQCSWTGFHESRRQDTSSSHPLRSFLIVVIWAITEAISLFRVSSFFFANSLGRSSALMLESSKSRPSRRRSISAARSSNSEVSCDCHSKLWCMDYRI